jgi:hypothetical protein
MQDTTVQVAETPSPASSPRWSVWRFSLTSALVRPQTFCRIRRPAGEIARCWHALMSCMSERSAAYSERRSSSSEAVDGDVGASGFVGRRLCVALEQAAAGAAAFGEAAARAGLDRIIYLGGLADDADHLRSRREVENLLGAGGVLARQRRRARSMRSGDRMCCSTR